MGFLHDAMPYRVVLNIDMEWCGNKVVAYFCTKKRAEEYIQYLGTVDKGTYYVQDTPKDL
jgi:hypothetical protein